jgi:hypothetical protein
MGTGCSEEDGSVKGTKIEVGRGRNNLLKNTDHRFNK